MTNHPTLPAEGAYGELEQHFINSSPEGLWPENQDSNFGQWRKVFTDIAQEKADELSVLNDEIFVDTASRYLSLWEEQMDVPIAVAGKTDANRRATIRPRLIYGPFSRLRRQAAIESFLLDVISGGSPATFGSLGIPIDASGIPLFSGVTSLVGVYRVYEDVQNFSYKVWIRSDVTPDMNGLTRELKRMTPAHMSFTIDNSQANVLRWIGGAAEDLSPSGWWRLDTNYNDFSGLGHTGTVAGVPAVIAAPGLMTAGLNGTDGARDFSGTGQYVTIADSPRLNTPTFSFLSGVRPDTLPATGNYRFIYTGGNSNFLALKGFVGGSKFIFSVNDGTTIRELVGTTTPVAGTIYRVSATFDGKTAKLFVNGLVEASLNVSAAVLTGPKAIAGDAGGGNLWDGGLDEIMFLPYALSPEKMLTISKTTKNIA
jgi:hypothetical protein